MGDSEIQNSAVENTILNLLAASETNYDYPSLQKDAVDIIATNLSDIIYTTLKQKSIASSTKRCNLLKFLNHISKTPEFHDTNNHYKIYLEGYAQESGETNGPEAQNLSHIILKELDDHSLDIHDKVIEFYKRKNTKRKDKIKKHEFIHQLDQEKLKLNLGMHLSKTISHYETSTSLIDDLLKGNKKESTKPIPVGPNKRDYREKQVQFCYALINIGSNNDNVIKILKSTLQKFSTYGLLERCEVNFLMELWLLGENVHIDLSKMVTENFSFVIEKMIIQLCTDIIKLKESSEVSKYFSALSTNSKIARLRDVCTKNLVFYYKVKNVIYELYVLSYCNHNILKLCDYII